MPSSRWPFQYSAVALLLLSMALGAVARSAEADSCQGDRSQDTTVSSNALPINTRQLPNAIRVHPQVISGGQPQGDDGFAHLRCLGIRTIISVDGMKPDVEAATRHDLRYVHLPHGYDGIPPQRLQELAHAFLTLPGPIYVHCHHGQHRSPAATAAACIVAGLITPQQGIALLHQAETGAGYTGLWESVRSAIRADTRQLKALEVKFAETVNPPALVQAMTELDATMEHLERFAANHWKPDPQHPDLAADHEALMLREQFTELLRLEAVHRQPAEFQTLVNASLEQARLLESLLTGANADRHDESTHVRRNSAVHSIRRRCTTCHQQFRDDSRSR